jgi:hypothetical protein
MIELQHFYVLFRHLVKNLVNTYYMNTAARFIKVRQSTLEAGDLFYPRTEIFLNSWYRYQIEASGRLHALAALRTGKSPRYPLQIRQFATRIRPKHSGEKTLPTLAGSQIPLALPSVRQFAESTSAAHRKLTASCFSSASTDHVSSPLPCCDSNLSSTMNSFRHLVGILRKKSTRRKAFTCTGHYSRK